MNKIIFILITLLLCSSIVSSQSNRRVEFKELGLSFEMPNGWTGRIEGEFYLMGHSTIPGLMILSQNTSKNAKQLKNLALQGISAEGIQLSPKGEFKTSGNDRVEGFYEGIFNGSRVRVFSIGLINQLGSGMNISIVTEIGKFSDTHIQEAEKLAGTVKFFRRIESPNTKFWKQRIVGTQLKYLNTKTTSNVGTGYTGASIMTIIKLFDDGTLYFYSNASVIHGKSGTREEKGSYRIYSVQNRSYLELNFGDQTIEYELSRSPENYTLLDGQRFAVLDINRP